MKKQATSSSAAKSDDKTEAEAPKPTMKQRLKAALRELGLIALAVLVIQVGLVQAYHVPTGSMERTVMSGDYLLIDKVTLGPRTPDWLGIPFTEIGTAVPAVKLPGLRSVHPGDIVVARTPMDEHIPYFKRVVAVGGQTLEIRNKELYIDGEKQDNPEWAVFADAFVQRPGMLVSGIHPDLGNRDNWGPYVVPPDFVFLMGDNRDNSVDSRYFGPIPSRDVIGLARVVYFSIDRKDSSLRSWQRPRWSRIGSFID